MFCLLEVCVSVVISGESGPDGRSPYCPDTVSADRRSDFFVVLRSCAPAEGLLGADAVRPLAATLTHVNTHILTSRSKLLKR